MNMAPTATVHYNNMPYSRLHSKLNMLCTNINVTVNALYMNSGTS